jgi:hypothetical protein
MAVFCQIRLCENLEFKTVYCGTVADFLLRGSPQPHKSLKTLVTPTGIEPVLQP